MANNMGKGLAMFILGEKSMEAGMNILGAHIDSPRIDLKQVPMFEDTQMAMLDTHYYGGIKKYQWVALPLALHGVICKKDGSVVNVNIGDKAGDPVFGISDLLIHLSADQLDKKAAKVIEGESLDLLIGSIHPRASSCL
jgi:aspartyl aminopeptidase